jgi:DNA-binding GntR family transcriptional regulator
MNISSLTPRVDPTPVYYRIATVLRTAIGTTWKSGDLLPAEQHLARKFRVSVGTMRHAIQLLVREGLLLRQQGRGTQVRRSIPMDQQHLTGSLKELMQFEPEVRVRVLSRRRVVPTLEVRLALQVKDDEPVVQVRRLFSFKRSPFAHVVSYVPSAYEAATAAVELRRLPIVSLLEQECGRTTSHADQAIAAGVADAESARLLQVPLGFPLLAIARTFYERTGQSLFYSKGEYRADRYRYVVTVQTGQGL